MSKKRKSAFGPTQKDIAEALGIAQTTVALALNPKYAHRYPEATIEKIRQKAKEMGYRPQRFAQIMRRSRSRTIGIVSQTSSFEASRLRLQHLVTAFTERDYLPIVADLAWFRRDLSKALNYLRDQFIEGIAGVSLNALEAPTIFQETGLPCVYLTSPLPDALPSVQEDLEAAFRQLTRHHLDRGSRRLTLLLNQRSDAADVNRFLGHTQADRIRGFAAEISAAGGSMSTHYPGFDLSGILSDYPFAPRESASIHGEIHAPHMQWSNVFTVGREMGRMLLQRQEAPESILASDDDLAIGVLSAAQELGVALPEGVRVSGYDATEVSAFIGTPITTVSVPFREMAEATADLLISAIEQPGVVQSSVTRFRGELLVRRSTASVEVR